MTVEDLPPRPSNRFVVALGLSAMLSPLGSTMVAVAIPSIARSFHTSAHEVTPWLVTSYLVVGIVCQSPGGKLGDLLGHQRVLRIGQAVFVLGALAGFFASGLYMLACARVLMAASGAIMMPAAVAILRNTIPAEQRTRAFGAFGAMMALAATVGPPLGSVLTNRFGWPSIFLANAPILLLSVAMAAGVAKSEAPLVAKPSFDVLGSVLLAVALTGAVVALSATAYRVVCLGVAGLAFVGFILWERVVANPVIDFALFRKRDFTAGSLLVALQNLAMYALIFQLPALFEECRGASHGAMGLRLTALMLPMLLFSFAGGRIAEKFGPRITAFAGCAVACGGMLSLQSATLLTPNDTVPYLLVLGTGLGMTAAPSQTSAMNSADPSQSGMAAGVMATMRYLGGVAGSAVLAAMLGGDSLAQRLAHHSQAMLVFAGSLALAGLCALALPRHAPVRRASL